MKMLQRAILLLYFFVEVFGSNASNPKIIIVGAGAAGITAASKLMENGFDNVIVLEAENRIGGRTYTTDLGGYEVDIGAQWVHGEEGNVIYDLASPLGVIGHSDPVAPHIILYTSRGLALRPELLDEVHKFNDKLLDEAVNQTKNHKGSVGEYVEEQFKVFFEKYPEIDEPMQKQILWHLNLMQCSFYGADSWHHVSMTQFSEFQEIEGDQLMHWKNTGYHTMFDILMKRKPNPEEELPVLNNTYLNTEVIKVDYGREDGKVNVLTSDGREFLADHVIMTPSLGVLKAKHKTMFDPPLPKLKINSIEGLGYGAAAKIILAYDEPWWVHDPKQFIAFTFLWDEDDIIKLSNDPQRKWMLSIVAFSSVEYKPHILLCTVTGVGARWVDLVPDDLIVDQIQYTLNKFLSPSYNISTPRAMKRYQWTTHKNFLGTYSFRSMDADKLNASAQELSEPIMQSGKPIVLFAGEATSPHHFSTTHAAVGTGLREADRLINFYKSSSTINDKNTAKET